MSNKVVMVSIAGTALVHSKAQGKDYPEPVEVTFEFNERKQV